MEWLLNPTGWLILGFILLILEIIIPGVFLIWWGLSSLILAGITKLIPEVSPSWQITIFAITACILSFLWWKYQSKKDQLDDKQTQLNQRDNSMMNSKGVVVEILESGIARGKFGDTTWRIVGYDLKEGDQIIVTDVEGITLQVKKTN